MNETKKNEQSLSRYCTKNNLLLTTEQIGIIWSFISSSLKEARQEGYAEALIDVEEENKVGLCDVLGCEYESVTGGTCWRETGYWRICSKHSDAHRKGMPQPEMKPEAVEKESKRDPVTGYLPQQLEKE